MATQRTACCIKGYAKGIRDRGALDRIARQIHLGSYSEVFWDGDYFREDSFTLAVREVLVAALAAGRPATLFKHRAEGDSVLEPGFSCFDAAYNTTEFSFAHPAAGLHTWRALQVQLFDIANPEAYSELGVRGMDHVLAQGFDTVDVVCIGGGTVVCEEMVHLKARGLVHKVRVHVYDVPRITPKGVEEHTRLPAGSFWIEDLPLELPMPSSL
eukprot:m.54059 g.54059  ORF g.54059 m.54059 type:complete len:213 (+) comp6554_c0_seq1:2-640(+)